MSDYIALQVTLLIKRIRNLNKIGLLLLGLCASVVVIRLDFSDKTLVIFTVLTKF